MSTSSRTAERELEENAKEVPPRANAEVVEVVPVVRDVTATNLPKRSLLKLPPHDCLYDYPLLLFI